MSLIHHFRIGVFHRYPSESQPTCALRFGIPLPVGTDLKQLPFLKLSSNGLALNSQLQPLTYWSDGSVQWASVDLIADHSCSGSLQLQTNKEPCKLSSNDYPIPCVQVTKNGAQLEYQPSNSKSSTPKLNLSLTISGTWGTTQVPFDPVVSNPPEPHSLRVPIQTTAEVNLGSTQAPFPIEFELHGSFWCTGQIDLALTIRNPNPAQHPGGNWDLGNPGSLLIQDLSVQLVLSSDTTVEKLLVRETLSGTVKQANQSIELFQASSGGENWNSSNHIDRNRNVPMPFRGYRLRVDDNESTANRATPYVALESGGATLAVARTRFWQNFPMAIRASGNRIDVGLLPKESGYPHELQGGEQKTFQFAAYYGTAAADSMPLDGYLSEPYVVIDREYLRATGVLATGVLGQQSLETSDDEPARLYEKLVAQAIDGSDSFFAKREKIDEYGWRHYGDVYGDHEAVYHRGPTPLISHYNNQYDCVLGFFYQFMRTGDWRWYEQMIAMADHAWDIDTYHTQGDKLLYNGGLFWHTYHYADADTANHRSYPRSLLQDDHFESGKDLGSLGKTGEKLKKVYGKGGGPAASHNYSTGWMYAYYLTGEARYKKAAIEAADYVIRIEDGSKTPFRWLANHPTGYSTCSSHGYYGPGRASANSTLALLTGFELTGDRKYLEMAVALMRRTVHPQENLERLDLLNAELRWFYTMYLQALCRLIDVLEQTPGQEASLQYGVASLLHYARWMVVHERPILDTPERLQYPTETWAAQDIRKWHTLAYAARWCSSQQEGQAMMDKAEWFYDYVMRTLDGFETKSLCRPVVLLMNYGWQRDGMLKAFHEMGLRSIELPTQWPPNVEFVPQKQIAMQRAKRLVVSVGALSVLAIGWLSWWLISG